MCASSRSDVQGYVSPGFGAVADRFRRNFSDFGEAGAALSILHEGRRVVDIWAGRRNAAGAPWQEDTVVPVFSASKGLVAITCLVAASAGRFSLDDEVSRYWPRFARLGKAGITIRQILDHKSGLVLFGRPVTRVDLADRRRMSAVIEDMRPRWRPGSAWGYHLATFGALLAEILARADPQARSFARIFEEDVARPLQLSFRFGLSNALADERRAFIMPQSAGQILRGLREAPASLRHQAFNPFGFLLRTLVEIRDIRMNARGWLRNEFPSANGVGEARAMATLYAALAESRNALGIRADLLAEIAGPAAVPPSGSRDRVMGVEGSWRSGFMKPSGVFRFSPSARAFGMPGFGGAFAFYDPDRDLAFAYTPNRAGLLPFNDPREVALREAVYAVLGS